MAFRLFNSAPKSSVVQAVGPGWTQECFDLLPEPLFVLDQRLHLLGYNAAARQQWPLAQAGMPFALLLRSPELLGALQDLSGSTEVIFRDPRGPDRWLRAHLVPLSRPQAKVMLVLHDQTAIRRQEAQHRDFVANASHELKTPLASLSGMLELIDQHRRDDPTVVERFLPQMQAQVTRMLSLVEDLLSLDRITAQETKTPREQQDLRLILDRALAIVTPMAHEGQIQRQEAMPGPALVAGDASELQRALVNLLENALRHGRGAPVVVRLWREGHLLAISVRDQGPGIAREHLPRLTERFYRVPGSGPGGTGLGLAIVKHVALRHRGRLEIDSTPGKGSNFTLWLPEWPGDTDEVAHKIIESPS